MGPHRGRMAPNETRLREVPLITSHDLRVLIVEDDEPIRALIAATVPDDWQLFMAEDGLEALAVARQHKPDAIILDNDLPMLSGSEVCEILRREEWCAQTRIIGLTASADSSVRAAFTRAGADAFLNKPFSPMQLLDLVDSWQDATSA